MTTELRFFDPETGRALHRVPDGATIPEGVPCGHIGRGENGKFWWHPRGFPWDFHQGDGVPRFTREPIPPPAPPLPTEPGYYTDKDGDLWQLDTLGTWRSAVKGISFTPQGVERLAPFVPVTLVPTETWDRLRVLDPEDKRDRVDAYGGVWRYNKDFDGWEHENGIRHYTLEVVDRHDGPLRFADEVECGQCHRTDGHKLSCGERQ